ncbi:MAG: molecular chaperone TorD family protein [Anaerolineales bacterium]|nr:molecular chaperone TorD family protein [Anaerolineales bacterium]
MLSLNPNSRINGVDLNLAQTAQARHYAYALFGRLFLEGETAVLRPFLAPIPELAAVLTDPFDADETAAAHYHLFQLNLFPYESIFLGTDGLLGGPVTDAVLSQYEQSGFHVDTSATSPDHIGYELAFLSFLCGAEADAWEDGLGETAVLMQQRQHMFLQRHLLRWLPPLAQAIRSQEQPLYTALADLTVNFVADHAAQSTAQPSFTLPALPDLLNNDKTGLKEIANYLTTPAYSGVFLSHDRISLIARQHQLPRGFGNRVQMITNLMRTAVQYNTLPTLLQTIQQQIIEQETAYRQIGTTHPHLAVFITPWQMRLQATQNMLQTMQEQTPIDK